MSYDVEKALTDADDEACRTDACSCCLFSTILLTISTAIYIKINYLQ